MPSITVVNMEGSSVGTIDLAESVFGIEPNAAVMHQMVVNYLAAQRQGTQSALTRSEVSGGGKKPWRQKGTGRARQGSTRAPQWTHGGIVFAPKPRSYRFTVNKKVRRLAMKSAFSTKAAESNIIVVDSIATDEYKTKKIAAMLNAIGAEKKALIVLPEVDSKVIGIRMIAHDIIVRPIITEKSMLGAVNKVYTFEVAKTANKIEIAKACEAAFKVKVAKVNTVSVRGKFRRQGRNNGGYTKSWKKAIITLTEDSKPIEFFEGMM